MRAVTWQGVDDVRVENVPDPAIREPSDAIIRVTSTAICGSDLHLLGPMAMYMEPGDLLGHEAMGVVEEVGPDATRLAVGDRVVVPFNVSCGTCRFCRAGLMSQCLTTSDPDQGTGAALFGYSKLYGHIPGGQAEYLRVPQAQYGPVVVPDDAPDTRYLFLSDILPTAWQAVEYADVPPGGSVLVWGLGPVGQLAARVAAYRGAGKVFGVDPVAERRALATEHGVQTMDSALDVRAAVREFTDGLGPDAVIDAVGMESAGNPVAGMMQRLAPKLPGRMAEFLADHAAVDRLSALHSCIEVARRGSTVSVVGVYGGMIDPMPMMTVFDKQLTLRFGQANVRRWTDDILALLMDGDPLKVDDIVTHRVGLEAAPAMYETFKTKADGCVKVVMTP
jgi:threonine dehydrogenase-like Zn-dependent dehydrogenase